MTDDPKDAGTCPACGGAVKELESGQGECVECGLALSAGEDDTADRVAAVLRARLKAGAGLEDALRQAMVQAGVRFAPLEEPAASPGRAAAAQDPEDRFPCPVCCASNPESAESCSGCSLRFVSGPPPECPRCGMESPQPTCSCGAILTLERLLERFDDSARLVCRDCKQLYAVERTACADCEGELLPTDGLKRAAGR